jgi:hypothetical protein
VENTIRSSDNRPISMNTSIFPHGIYTLGPRCTYFRKKTADDQNPVPKTMNSSIEHLVQLYFVMKSID